MTSDRVVVAMSGGVDSSVAAYLLKEQGYDVVGVTMRLIPPREPGHVRQNRSCCTAADTEDARSVCRMLDIPHYVLNFEKEFHTHVIQCFLDEYRRGRTPNPCLACNDRIKFDFLMKRALALGAEKLATGHYSRIDRTGDRYRLLRALDSSKDQSYVLYGLGQRGLGHLLLPVGGHAKSGIRGIARELGMPVSEKPDSQDICFVPDGDYRCFVHQHLQPRPGAIVDENGRKLADHDGIESFTIGQRKGLGVNSVDKRFVLKILAEENRVVVGDDAGLYSAGLRASAVRYTSDAAPAGPARITARIRHRAPEVEATLVPSGQGAKVWFREPQRAVAPGQAVVFYDGEEVLGGGIIETPLSGPGGYSHHRAREAAPSSVSA